MAHRLSRSAAFAAALFIAVGADLPALAQPAPKGEVTVAMTALQQRFDPLAQVAMTDFMNYDFLFDGLLDLRPEGKQPALAESWTISADGKAMNFKLRQGVKFHNGDPFTSEDVKFTFDRVMAADSTHSYRQAYQESVERIDIVGPYEVRFVLKKPWPTFFTSSRYLIQVVPKKYFEKIGAKEFQLKPVGTGPFQLAGIKAGEWTRYEANPNYWGGAPKVQAVTLKLVKEPFTRYAMLERGEADIIMGVPGPLIERVRANSKLRLLSSRYVGTSSLFFNKQRFPEANDRRVRLAIAHALNREQIAKTVLGGLCEPATGPFTPATFGYLDGLPRVAYDPEKAKALLREAGVPAGHPITYALHTESFGSLPNAPQVLEAVAGNLEAVGFKVVREPYETGAILAMFRSGKQTSIFYGPSSVPDDGGETINGWYSSWAVWSTGNIKVPEYDKIFQDQLQTTNTAERLKLLQRFAKLENERLEAVPLFWCDSPMAVSARVKSMKPGLGSDYHLNLRELELAQ
jgi:peptide/nickel transport system substrate-binding protein